MNQAIEAAVNLENAVQSLSDIFSCVLNVGTTISGGIRVQLYNLRDLEQVPGEAVRLKSGSEKFPVEVRKTVGSVEFFVWLREEEV